MFGVCPLFTPSFRNSRLHPNVWGFVFFSPRGFYRVELAATWTPRQQLTGRGSHVAAMSAPDAELSSLFNSSFPSSPTTAPATALPAPWPRYCCFSSLPPPSSLALQRASALQTGTCITVLPPLEGRSSSTTRRHPPKPSLIYPIIE